MKNLIFILLAIISYRISCQTHEKQDPKPINCLTAKELAASKKDLIAKRDALLNARNISKSKLRLAAPQQILFRWPLQANADYDFTYNTSKITNFVDQNRNADPAADDDVREPEWIDDWNCGKRTYDNHDAQDIANWPFSWHMYDVSAAIIVAAADGEILEKSNGHYDKNCEWAGAGSPNLVRLLHADGTVSSYLHMKNGSLTSLPESTPSNPSYVKKGDYLGIVGSSGRSTGPHLHFSVYDINDNLIEPFTGNCNALNPTTWWENQQNYYNTQINKVMTHYATPIEDGCWGGLDQEEMNGRNNFSPGEFIWTSVAFQDALPLDFADCYLIQPNGNTYATWQHSFGTAGSSFRTHMEQLPNGNDGNWTVKVVYRGNNYYHFFTVNCGSTNTVSGAAIGSQGYITSNLISSAVAHTNLTDTKVLYQAANEITFSPGFEIKGGAHMKARIKGCDFVE